MVFFTAAAYAMGKSDLALLPAALAGGLVAPIFSIISTRPKCSWGIPAPFYGRRGVRHDGLCARYAAGADFCGLRYIIVGPCPTSSR